MRPKKGFYIAILVYKERAHVREYAQKKANLYDWLLIHQ